MEFYDLKPNQVFLVSQKALIVERDKLLMLQLPNQQWELPGGLLDYGEDLKNGLLREVYEETGLTIDVDKIVGMSDHRGHEFILRDGRTVNPFFILAAFACHIVSGDFQLSYEHEAYHWATRDEITQLSIAANSRFAIDIYLSTP